MEHDHPLPAAVFRVGDDDIERCAVDNDGAVSPVSAQQRSVPITLRHDGKAVVLSTADKEIHLPAWDGEDAFWTTDEREAALVAEASRRAYLRGKAMVGWVMRSAIHR